MFSVATVVPTLILSSLDLFDHDKTGEISYSEFGSLWRYVVDWQNCFKTFDK